MQKNNKALITDKCKAQQIATHWNYNQEKKKKILFTIITVPIPFSKQ